VFGVCQPFHAAAKKLLLRRPDRYSQVPLVVRKLAPVIAPPARQIRKSPVLVALFGRPRAYATAGDRAEAKAAYSGFLTLWKDAAPGIPILQQTRKEFAMLPAASRFEPRKKELKLLLLRVASAGRTLG